VDKPEEDNVLIELLAQKGFHEHDSQLFPLAYDFRIECRLKMELLDDEMK